MNDSTEEISSGDVKVHPIWKQAALDAIAEFDYGDIIPNDWIYEHLEIEQPEEDEMMTSEQHRRLAFDLLRKMDRFRGEMLENHKWFLLNIRALGYKIIEPPHQTEAAMKRFVREFSRSWHQAMSALVNINEAALTLDDMRANAEAKNKLAYIRAMGREQLEDKSEKPKEQAA